MANLPGKSSTEYVPEDGENRAKVVDPVSLDLAKKIVYLADQRSNRLTGRYEPGVGEVYPDGDKLIVKEVVEGIPEYAHFAEYLKFGPHKEMSLNIKGDNVGPLHLINPYSGFYFESEKTMACIDFENATRLFNQFWREALGWFGPHDDNRETDNKVNQDVWEAKAIKRVELALKNRFVSSKPIVLDSIGNSLITKQSRYKALIYGSWIGDHEDNAGHEGGNQHRVCGELTPKQIVQRDCDGNIILRTTVLSCSGCNFRPAFPGQIQNVWEIEEYCCEEMEKTGSSTNS